MVSQLYFIALSIYIVQCTKYETCAKLHMFHILYISHGCIPVMLSQLYLIVLPVFVPGIMLSDEPAAAFSSSPGPVT